MTKAELEQRLESLETENESLRAGGTVISNCTLNGPAENLCSAVEELAIAIQLSAKALRSAPLINIGTSQ